jgi:hypothetical protein
VVAVLSPFAIVADKLEADERYGFACMLLVEGADGQQNVYHLAGVDVGHLRGDDDAIGTKPFCDECVVKLAKPELPDPLELARREPEAASPEPQPDPEPIPCAASRPRPRREPALAAAPSAPAERRGREPLYKSVGAPVVFTHDPGFERGWE